MRTSDLLGAAAGMGLALMLAACGSGVEAGAIAPADALASPALAPAAPKAPGDVTSTVADPWSG